MVLFDTHCHLDFEAFAGDRGLVLERAQKQAVTKLFVPGVAPRCWAQQVRALRGFDNVHIGFGVHPFWAQEVVAGTLDALMVQLEAAVLEHGAVAIGECGLDALHAKRGGASLHDQMAIVERQLLLAKRLSLPVVLHCVKAHGQLLECLDRVGRLPAGGVLHAYSGAPELVPRYSGLGLYFGFGGAVTRPNAKRARAALQCVPFQRLVLESDAPDQPPAWLAGARNEPAELAAITRRVAELRGCAPEQLAERTWHNGCRLFGVD